MAKDYVEGYKWFLLAAGQGLEAAKEYATTLEGAMSQDQIAEGQKLARNFKPREVSIARADSSAAGIVQTRPEAEKPTPTERNTAVLSGPITQTITKRPDKLPPQEIREFLSVSRRLLVAIKTSLTYVDFIQRLIDVKASAEEALPKVNPEQRTNISNFVLALNDARSLWEYSHLTDEAKMRLTRDKDNHYGPKTYASLLGKRWNEDFQERVETYRLREKRAEPKSEPAQSPKKLSPEETQRAFQGAFAGALAEVGADVGMYDPALVFSPARLVL